MLSSEDAIRFQHMLEAATEAIGYAAGRSRASLDAERPIMHSLVRCLEIVGEAASQVSAQGRALVPSLPWPAIVGMRNRIVHAYFDINLDIVWATVQEDMPALVAALGPLLRAVEPCPGSDEA